MKTKFHNNSFYLFILQGGQYILDLSGMIGMLWLVETLLPLSTYDSIKDLKFLFIIFGLSWITIARWFKLYSFYFNLPFQLKQAYKGFAVHTLLNCIFWAYLFRLNYSHLFPLLIYIFGVLIYLPSSRYVLRFLIGIVDRKVGLRKRVAILGNGPLYEKITDYLNSEYSGCNFINVIPKQPVDGNSISTFIKCIQVAKKYNISEIYSTIIPESDEMHNRIVQLAEKCFIRFKFIPYFNPILTNHIDVFFESDLPIVTFSKEPLEDLDNRLIKRTIDILISSFVSVFLLSWLWPILAILIRLDSKGPVLFKQLRNGRNNKPFVCLKFRTMVLNSEANKTQAVKNDYRFTKIGKFLRKTNLDELPQFINVLKGEMSIIGPRPHMITHNKHYSDKVESYMKRHFIKPGISGWAQVNGLRGNLSQDMMEKRVKHDLYYINNWSPWLDLDISIKTLRLTIFGDKNAY